MERVCSRSMEQNSRRCMSFLYLHPSYSPWQFSAYLLAAYMTILCFVFFGSTASSVLTEILKLDTQVGWNLTLLTIYDECLSIPASFILGALSDKVGRFVIFLFGFVIIFITSIIYPFLPNYSILVCVRLFFSVGTSACSSMLCAMLGDCAGTMRGRIAGTVGLMNSFGALTAVFLFGKIPSWINSSIKNNNFSGIHMAYFIFGAFIFVLTLIFGIMSSIKKKKDSTAQDSDCKVTKANLKETFKAALFIRDWRIAVAYATSFSARASTALSAVYISHWVNMHFYDQNICNYKPGLYEKSKTYCEEAFKRMGILNGTYYLAVLIFAPIWGITADYIGATTFSKVLNSKIYQHATLPSLISAIISLVGFFALYFLPDALDNGVIPACIVLGSGNIGSVIASSTMISSEYVSSSARGAIAGAFSFFGSGGILICLLASLPLISGNPASPFLILGVIQIIVIILCFLAILFGPNAKELLSVRTSKDSSYAKITVEAVKTSQPS